MLRQPPQRLVLVAPVSEAPPDRGLMGVFAAKEPATVEALAAEALKAGVKQVAILRHGELFGGGSGAAFTDGLRKAPTLYEDFSRRGILYRV